VGEFGGHYHGHVVERHSELLVVCVFETMVVQI
jgi:hypothetical protein